MKSDPQRRLATLFFVLVFSLTVVTVTSADDVQKPRITIEEMRHDLGQVFERDVYRHEFKVKNTGNVNLKIQKVKPG
jgi:hypothetical protein